MTDSDGLSDLVRLSIRVIRDPDEPDLPFYPEDMAFPLALIVEAPAVAPELPGDPVHLIILENDDTPEDVPYVVSNARLLGDIRFTGLQFEGGTITAVVALSDADGLGGGLLPMAQRRR